MSKSTTTPTLTKAQHRRAISDAMVALAHAQIAVTGACRAALPIGGEVHYFVRGHLQLGTVLDHNEGKCCGSMKVENQRTGKSYWIWIGDVRGFGNAARAGWAVPSV